MIVFTLEFCWAFWAACIKALIASETSFAERNKPKKQKQIKIIFLIKIVFIFHTVHFSLRQTSALGSCQQFIQFTVKMFTKL